MRGFSGNSLMVLEAAARLTDDPKVRFAALVHDLGKGLTPMSLWPKHHGHEQRGVKLIEGLCERLRIPSEYRALAIMVSCYHLTVHRLFELKPHTMVRLLEKTDAFRRTQRFFDLLIACEADAQGCGRMVHYQQREIWQTIYKVCATISAKMCIEQGYEGKAIKEALHRARIAAVQKLKNSRSIG